MSACLSVCLFPPCSFKRKKRIRFSWVVVPITNWPLLHHFEFLVGLPMKKILFITRLTYSFSLSLNHQKYPGQNYSVSVREKKKSYTWFISCTFSNLSVKVIIFGMSVICKYSDTAPYTKQFIFPRIYVIC